jgi:hypothetical protein
MKIKFGVTSICVITSLFSLIISNTATMADGQQWQPMPEAEYAQILELIASATKANYEEISTWQGQMNILETTHFYGPAAAGESHGLNPDSVARNSQHICRTDKVVADFAVDMRSDKLYSAVDPNSQYRAVDLDYHIPSDQYEGRPARTRTILTPESYMWYLTDGKFHSNSQKGPRGKMVFIESPQNENIKGLVRDPRDLFNSGGEDKKLWETLLQIKGNINERINERVAGFPHIEISSLNTENGTKYRILTTWRGGENYVIKYIRCLLEVDEAVGFNTLRTETILPNGVKTNSTEYTYGKVGEIYIPRIVKKEQCNHKGEPTFTSETTVETTGLNTPLPEDTFTIKNLGLEDGTLVTDKITNSEFRYTEGNLVPISEINNSP